MTAMARIITAILLVDKSQGVNFSYTKIGRAQNIHSPNSTVYL